MLVQIKSPSRLTSFSSWDVAQGQIGQDHHHYNGCAVQELEGQEHHIEECSQQEDLVITHLKDVQIFKGSPRSVSRRNKLHCSSYIMIKFLLTSEATKNSVKLPLFYFPCFCPGWWTLDQTWYMNCAIDMVTRKLMSRLWSAGWNQKGWKHPNSISQEL